MREHAIVDGEDEIRSPHVEVQKLINGKMNEEGSVASQILVSKKHNPTKITWETMLTRFSAY